MSLTGGTSKVKTIFTHIRRAFHIEINADAGWGLRKG